MKISFSKISLPKTGALVIPVVDGKTLSPKARELDRKSGGVITGALQAVGFKGKQDEMIRIALPHGIDVQQIIVFGIEKKEGFKELKAQATGGKLFSYLNRHKIKSGAVLLDTEHKEIAEYACNLAFGATLKSYRFDKYRTKQKDDEKQHLGALSLMLESPEKASKAYTELDMLAESVFAVRDVVSEPANVITPKALADKCKELSKIGVDVEVLDKKTMAKLGMGALLGVGQGSANDPYLVTMRWEGAKSGGKPLAFVGKGVTFDSGGISIKPAGGMEEMKWDMGGAGTVYGLMRHLAERKAKVNAVGVVALVENMPSGTAQRPGDVVKSMSGQTIEVINTDAEGRLILADALWHAQEKFQPRLVIDLATLTGAIIVALGSSRAGLFSNNDDLAEKIAAAASRTGEEVWRLPLGEVYDKQINSDIADMKNVGEGREAGSITAAQFLARFIKEGTPWAHLDIAGVAWNGKERDSSPKGASGFGVCLLNRMIKEFYE